MVDEINFLSWGGGVVGGELLEREGAKERLQHLLHWQGCGTMFISVSARRRVCRVGGGGVALL